MAWRCIDSDDSSMLGMIQLTENVDYLINMNMCIESVYMHIW